MAIQRYLPALKALAVGFILVAMWFGSSLALGSPKSRASLQNSSPSIPAPVWPQEFQEDFLSRFQLGCENGIVEQARKQSREINSAKEATLRLFAQRYCGCISRGILNSGIIEVRKGVPYAASSPSLSLNSRSSASRYFANYYKSLEGRELVQSCQQSALMA